MSKTVNQLKASICAFIGRKAPTLVVEGADLVLDAMNDARVYAERLIDFEWSRVTATVSASQSSGGSIDTAVLYGSTTAVSIKKVLFPFLVLSDDVSQTPMPVDFWSGTRWVNRLKRVYDKTIEEQPLSSTSNLYTPSRLVVVQDGKTLYATPTSSTVLGSTYNIHFKGIKWLDNYVTGDETDFLLDYGFDWIKYRSLQELNFYLKEDERVALNATMVSDAWNSLLHWNTTLVEENVDDADLN